MVATRRDGVESSRFNGWLREQGKIGKLPSSGTKDCYTGTDVDMCWRQYQHVLRDGDMQGFASRKVQLLMLIESKTFDADLKYPQNVVLETLDAMRVADDSAIYFGVYLLRMGGACPDTSVNFAWGRVSKELVPISKDTLFQILRFEVHPETLEPLDKDSLYRL